MAEDPVNEVLVIRDTGMAAARRSRADVAAQPDGGVLHRYGARVEIRRGVLPGIGGDAAAAAAPGPPDASLSLAERLGVEAFRLRLSDAYQQAKANRPRDGETWDMTVACATGPNRPGSDDAMRGAALAAAPTSAHLNGSVAVGVIIVNGPTAALQFTAAEQTKVVAEVQAGLTWLANQNPGAGVSWTYDVRVVNITTAANATAPNNEERWRNPAMRALGFAETWQGVIDYVQGLRNQFATRWAYCGFFVKYPLDHFAYASIGGPRLVMDYNNDGWGPDNIDRVFTHETGHIFACPDEYRASNCSCGGSWGVYGEPNRNCESCAANGGVSCLMRANDWTMCASTRLHLGWALGSARVPQGAPVHAVSRSADLLDIFFTDKNGWVQTAAWAPWMPVWWQGFWSIRGGRAAPGAPVTCVSRGPDKLDIFVVGTDNHVYTAAWRPDSGGWQGWWRIGDIRVPHGSAIHGVARSLDHLDIFCTDENGVVRTAAWEPGFTDGWHGWWELNGGRAAPGAPVTCVARGPDKLDVFVIGTDGRAWTAAWEPGLWWRGWWAIHDARFPAGSTIWPVTRSLDHLDIFGADTAGRVLTAAWEPAFTDGWHGWWHLNGGMGAPGAPVTAVSRSADKLDVFVVGADGGIYTAAWEVGFTDGWHGWWRLNGGSANGHGAIVPVSRSANKLDVFVVGLDERVWTAAWEPTFTDWWHGWWPLGS